MALQVTGGNAANNFPQILSTSGAVVQATEGMLINTYYSSSYGAQTFIAFWPASVTNKVVTRTRVGTSTYSAWESLDNRPVYNFSSGTWYEKYPDGRMKVWISGGVVDAMSAGGGTYYMYKDMPAFASSVSFISTPKVESVHVTPTSGVWPIGASVQFTSTTSPGRLLIYGGSAGSSLVDYCIKIVGKWK